MSAAQRADWDDDIYSITDLDHLLTSINSNDNSFFDTLQKDIIQ